MGSAYGLRTAPRSWYLRVKADLQRLGWRMHQLDPCVFLIYDKKGELLGLCGVYVDDFLIAGAEGNQEWEQCLEELKALYRWGKWERDNFTLCGVRYRQYKDYG